MSVSPEARVDPSVRLGPDVDIGPFSIVHAGVNIGAGSRIGPFCEIGAPLPSRDTSSVVIGARANIRSHSVVYGDCAIGDDFETGHRVTIREASKIGDGVRIGTSSDIQGDCSIGDYARLHSSVFVAKLCTIGRFAWLSPRVVLTNDPTPPSERLRGCVIGDYAVVAAGALVLSGVSVGTGALVSAMACVSVDVPAGMLARGVPARIIGRVSEIRLRGDPPGAAYPWRRQFHRGYPPEWIRAWLSEQLGDQMDQQDAT
jgi:UDP-3-O-[3-hydroxymyristoyl] glucosamine N-acyltransferase